MIPLGRALGYRRNEFIVVVDENVGDTNGSDFRHNPDRLDQGFLEGVDVVVDETDKFPVVTWTVFDSVLIHCWLHASG